MISLLTPPCPACTSTTFRELNGPFQHAALNYYRCGLCGHVWQTPNLQGDFTDTVKLRRKPDRRKHVRA